MNHIYRSIWNEALGAWVAVSEISKGQGKRAVNRRKLLATSLLICTTPTWALPTGDQLVAGQATVSTPTANVLQIDQASQKAVINWQGFSVAPTEVVNINQPDANAALLNRVVGQDASQIQGQINANGQVYLVNPNGVVFSKTAQVDVGGLIATTHDISNADFINGNQHFTQNGATGAVENHGTINAKDGGVVALIGEQVINTGTINTPKGTTALAAGKTVDLDFQGNGLIAVKVTEAALNAQITNQGAIQADGGRVVMTAKAANQLINTVINQEGVVKARGLVERNGEIILEGGDNGITQVSGTLDVSGNGAGEKGGKIIVTGDKVLVDSSAKLNAAGATGGGEILVGGSWQNSDTSVRQANATIVKQGAILDASATDNGKGGTVVAWSNIHDPNSATRAWGTFLAKGGVNGGDGGRIETSGHWLNTDNIKVDASATRGNSGLWLLDPWDVIIQNVTSGNAVFTNPFAPVADSTILASDISAALSNGISVTITTGTTGTTSAGNITVNSSISKTLGGDATLTLQAANRINVNPWVTIASLAGRLNLDFQSASDGSNGAVINIQGATINSDSGTIRVSMGRYRVTPSRSSSKLASSTGGGYVDGVYIIGNSSINSGTGTISIEGIAQGQDITNYSQDNAGVPKEKTIAATGGGGITLIGSSNGKVSILPEVLPPVVVQPVNQALQDNIAGLITSVANQPLITFEEIPVSSDLFVNDITDDFANNTTDNPANVKSDLPCNDSESESKTKLPCQKRKKSKETARSIIPILKIKNSLGRVKHLEMSANKNFVSLLFEDGSVRVWDFKSGIQRQIVASNNNQQLTDIGTVNDKGDSLPIASKTGIDIHDIISSLADDKLAINEPDVTHFVNSEDGTLLLVDFGANELNLWDNKQNKKRWQLPYQRGTVHNLALTTNKRYGAVLSRQAGTYVMPADLQFKSVTDAIDIVDLDTGKIIKSLPNMGEQIVYMQFKDNDTLSVGLASGELLDWAIPSNTQETAAHFSESLVAVDKAQDTYAYLLKDGTVRVGDGQGHIRLSLQNKDNAFQDAKLLEDGKQLLTILANGDLTLWDVASGKKMLRLFSAPQGWTVMDGFGRFDGSEEAIANFSWLANEEDIPLDNFSENYYEPGLLSNVLQNQDYLNSDSDSVRDGISLPPKVNLQLAEQQTKGDNVALQLDVYNRGGGIDKINLYHNGKLLSNEGNVVAAQTQQDNPEDHRALMVNITPSAGKNTLKVVASNDMGIENSGTELSFDGKTKAYTSSLRLLTIGIDKYSDANLDLDYSVADANAIVKAIKTGANTTVSKHLINENATKPKILAALKELSQGTQQDVLVVYFAGHGLAVGKEWYFLPHETTLQDTPEKIAAAGITATELSDTFKHSKIQHILLMVDSCYSGAGMNAFSQLQNGQRYFTRQLSRSLGITVITATTKDQAASELKNLGHGLFTYLITQDLEKKDATGSTTAHGVAENITKTLPVFSKKMLGSSQDPAVYTHGNDFMLTDILELKH